MSQLLSVIASFLCYYGKWGAGMASTRNLHEVSVPDILREV